MTVATVGASSVPAWANTPASTPDNTQMTKDTFLKLLIAQVKFQDPSKPMDNSAMIAQSAQFTQVEKMDELVKQNAELLLNQRMLSAGQLAGTQVTYLDDAGTVRSGRVDSVRINETEPLAMIGGKEVPIGRIQTISQGAPPASATPVPTVPAKAPDATPDPTPPTAP
ncbi:flagellar hook assembly protein FlgD [Tessaracoccus sp.]